MRSLRGLALLCLAPLLVTGVARGVSPEEADRIVKDALARAVDETKQVRVLLDLAWLQAGVDPAVSSRAQEELGSFGGASFPTLLWVVNRVRPDQVASVLRTLTAAHGRIPENPASYRNGLVDALWVGDREAKSLAIALLTRAPSEAAVQPMIDCALDDPSLLPAVLEALAATRDDRARFFLDGVFNGSDPRLREASASALARIGGRALQPLRSALRSSSREVRLAAIRALLPVASEGDLTALYEYAQAYPEDDPATIQEVLGKAAQFEEAIARRQASDSASPSPDF